MPKQGHLDLLNQNLSSGKQGIPGAYFNLPLPLKSEPWLGSTH